jgi:prepilin-type N-terminal cleavage/methylation domain-containing protein
MKISLRNLNRTAATATTDMKGPRKGFAIVEIIVAMVLLAIAVSSLAALSYSVSQSGIAATGNAYRNGVLMQEVNRLEGIPYDSIPCCGTTTVVVTTNPYPHTTTITVAEPNVQLIKTVKVIIRPTNVLLKPDTASFIRTKAKTSQVLCTDCVDNDN